MDEKNSVFSLVDIVGAFRTIFLGLPLRPMRVAEIFYRQYRAGNSYYLYISKRLLFLVSKANWSDLALWIKGSFVIRCGSKVAWI